MYKPFLIHKITVVVVVFLISLSASGQVNGDYRTRASGNWNSNTTWQVFSGGTWVNCSTGDWPGASAGAGTVSILDNTIVNIISAIPNNIGALTIDGGSNSSYVQFGSSGSLTVTGETYLNSNSNWDEKSLLVDSGTFRTGSVSANSAGTNNRRDAYIRISTGNVTVDGDINLNSLSQRTYILFTDEGNLYVGGTITGGIITSTTGGGNQGPTSGTVIYNNAGAQVAGAYEYNNITLTGTGAKTVSGITVNGILSMEGTATAAGTTPSYGASSTIQYRGSAAQVTGIEMPVSYSGSGGVIIDNSSGITLSSDITISSLLTMIQGNITTGSYTLILSNTASTSLLHTSGTIIGILERAIGTTAAEYLFPVGTSAGYNPFKITFNNLTAGQLAVSFQAADIGTTGLPLDDAGISVTDRHTTGYWTLTAGGSLASTNYDVNLNYSGFSDVNSQSRIIKRNDGGSLVIDGTHGTVSGSEITRTGMSGISSVTTDLGIGKSSSLVITSHPSDYTGCSSASFSVSATGTAPLSYQWQEDSGGGFTDIIDGGIYSGATGTTLTITGITDLMNGYLYRCIVTDPMTNSVTSNSAMLIVSYPVVSMGFNYSMDIEVDQASGPSDLTDFPLLINITNPLLRTEANGGHTTSASGYDIAFTDQDGNFLDHEIEYYDASTGEYVAWVRIPLLSSTSTTTIKMLYGNPAVTSDPSLESVWVSAYKGVWHLNGTDYSDATAYSNDGTENATTGVTGIIAGARGFNGSTSYIGVTTTGFVPNDNNQTISIWANYAIAPSGARNLISFQNAAASSAIQLGFRGGNAVAWKWGGVVLADGGPLPSVNAWHYYVYTFDGTNSRIYIDGVEMDNSTVAPQTAMPSEGNIGRYNDGEYIAANLDEPRFSISPKSAGWILTEYNNQNDPANFISLGSETDNTLLASVGECSTTFSLNQGYPAGGTYSGTGVSGTNFNASVAGVGTHTITYLYTDLNGCSNSSSKDILVTAVPPAPAATDVDCCILNILDLEASGTNLTWYNDAGLTSVAGTGTPFATGQTLAGVYTYYVTQTINGCESAATTVSLTIYSSISINTQPQPSLICEGEDATFSVDASGYNLTYQWQENGVDISDGGIYSGTTTPILTLTDPGLLSSGLLYSCVVSGSCGTPLTSDAALLTVTALPVATFSYTGSPYCPTATDPLPLFSGGGVAGTFSSTAGLIFISTSTGEVDLSASTPGSYIVTNTIAASGGCGIVAATSPLTIESGLTWTGTIDSDWNIAGNWSCGYIPGPTTDIRIADVPNKPVLNSGATGTANNIVIDAGASLTISGNILQVSGTITSSGIFDCTSGTVEMNGSIAQSIGTDLFSANTIMNLTVNNPAGVTLAGALNITGILTLQSGDLQSGGNLTLVSTAAQTAMIDGSGIGEVNGNITMQRYLPSGFGYKYFSSPFQASTVNEFADDMDLAAAFPLFYRYDESRTSSGWVNYSNPLNILNPLEGYAVNFGSVAAPNTVDLSGVVNNGSLSVTLYNNNNTYTKGLNLVGNPYPSPIDWDAGSGWTKTNIDNALYFFKASTTNQYVGTYSSYVNGISSDGTASNIIPSMQGFFIHVSDGAWPVTGTLGLDNSVRVTDLSHPFLKSKNNLHSTLLRIATRFTDDPESEDPAVLYFSDNAAYEFDNGMDALKLLNTNLNVPNIYFPVPGDKKLSVNALPLSEFTSISIPVGLKVNRDGSIVFMLKDTGDEYTGVDISLSDLISGSDYDLRKGNSEPLLLTAGEYNNRFLLNLVSMTTGTGVNSQDGDIFNIYSSGGILKADINYHHVNGKGIIEIYSTTGQKVWLSEIYNAGYYEFNPGLSAGLYIVSFKSGTIRSTKKLFIGNL